MSTLSALLVTVFALIVGVRPVSAMDQVAIENVQAGMRTLSFLDSLSQDGPIVVGVVYASDRPDAQAVAESTAQIIGSMRGPHSRALQPLVLSTNALLQTQGHLDVLWLTAGVCKHAELIGDSIRSHHLVTLSDDPLCGNTQCCVIAVHTGQKVDIALNTTLAQAVGARFSMVFIMMVKRQ